LNRDVERQASRTDGDPGVLAALAQHLDHQVRTAVYHLGMIGEVGRRVDVAAELYAAADPLEVSAEGGPELGEDVDAAQPGRLLRIVDRDISPGLAPAFDAVRPDRQLAGYEHQIAGGY